MSKQAKVVVVGSSNTDMVVKSQKIPAPGETVIGGTFVLADGGKGANQAVAAARLGAQVTFIAKVGTDMFGDQAINHYRNEGINTDYIFRDPNHATGVALILVDAKGENLISVASGANEFLVPADVERAETVIASADVVVIQLETSLEILECTAKLAKKYHVPLILDPAPAPNTPLLPNILADIACIKPNESETERLTGIRVTDRVSAQQAADKLLDMGVKSVLITMGNEGGLLVEKHGNGEFLPAYQVKAIDTTAAGDAFSGALACGIAEGKTLSESARIANAVAALSVMRLGAQPSLPTKNELESFLKHSP
ncbi:MAG: ribokinase [Planctomycetaceae bacterium]|jgi:ribokinase|nr:ribokinase [Planctomycetaceae bacterium]